VFFFIFTRDYTKRNLLKKNELLSYHEGQSSP